MPFNGRPPRNTLPSEHAGLLDTEFDDTQTRAEYNAWIDTIFQETDWLAKLTSQDYDSSD